MIKSNSRDEDESEDELNKEPNSTEMDSGERSAKSQSPEENKIKEEFEETAKSTLSNLNQVKDDLFHSKINQDVPTTSAHVEEEIQPQPSPQRRKKKEFKSKHTKNKSNVSPDIQKTKTDEDIVCIQIHESDLILTNGLVTKPTVEVFVVNQTSGQYMTKSVPPSGEDSVFISPVSTDVFDFHIKRCITPKWEESLFIHEPPSYIISPDTVLLFVILDRTSNIRPPSMYTKLGSSTSIRRVAWAFLKLKGANGNENVSKKNRLQLYKPRSNDMKNSDDTVPIVFKWFKKYDKCKKLKNSLYVTVHACPKPSLMSPASRAKVELQSERASVVSNGVSLIHSEEVGKPNNEKKPFQWSKLPGESCKIPNKSLLTLYGGTNVILAAKFSPDGLRIACALHSRLAIFNVVEGTLLRSYNAHHGLIYSLNWNEDNVHMLTTSADRTVRVWSSQNTSSDPVWILPHPSYVYDALFVTDQIITCCYDGVVRVWRKGDLLEELISHQGHVNSVCYNNGTLYSGDSQGVIIAWKYSDRTKRWAQERTILIHGIKGVIINTLIGYGRSSLIVHTQDSVLRMIDAASGVVLHWYKGCVNDSLKTGCILSPCKSLLFCANEDAYVYVWDTSTSALKGVYNSPGGAGSVALHYHPYDHILMMAVHSQHNNSLIQLISYVRGESGKSVGLHLLSKSKDQENSGIRSNEHKEGKQRRASLLSETFRRTSGGSFELQADHLDDKLSGIIRRMDKVLNSVN